MTEFLEEKIGYHFSNRSLLETALTHSSYANEHKVCSYERMEFLGDSVLGFIAAEYIYSQAPDMPEGMMTRLRSEQVSSKGLSEAAKRIDLGRYIRFSKGEEKSGGGHKASNLEDVMEALIAAIYLDAGLEETKKFVFSFILNHVDFSNVQSLSDNKSALQELLQVNGDIDLRYEEVAEYGPDHKKTFEFRVLLSDKEIGRGMGKSKKEAEQAAAGMALRNLKGE